MFQQISRLSLTVCLLFTALLLNIGISRINAQTNQGSANRPYLRSENLLDSLSQTELDGLLFMREEEKLARDVFIVLYQTWGERIFNNISRSEQTHTNAVKTLFEKYQIIDPVTNDSVGVFKNQVLQKLFNELTTRGKTSLVEALKVGALIEEIDILDLQKELNGVEGNDDIRYVYNNLMRGSRNHLRAFVRNLKRMGIEYAPVKLNSQEFNTIIESNWETRRN